MTDPVVYTVLVQHWQDGEIHTEVRDVGESESDRRAVAFALRAAADQVEFGEPIDRARMS